MRATRSVIAGELLIAVGLIVWTTIGGPPGAYAALACVACGALALTPPIRRAARLRWCVIQFAVRRARRKPHAVLAPALDVPLPAASWHPAGDAPRAQMGIRWIDDTLITMLALHSDPGTPTILTPDGIVDAETGQMLTVEAIAKCLNTFDITVDSVDLISHGLRMTGPHHLARVYDATLGPLPAVANRATFLVVRLRPAECPEAVARRGSGSSGAIRAATVTTRRIAHSLRDAGFAVTILTSRQITDATMLLADGIPVPDVGEAWSELTWSTSRLRTFAVDSDRVPTLAAATGWSHAALSTTSNIRIRPRAGGHEYTMLLRVNESPTLNRLLRQPIDGLIELPGRQFEAFCATLPVASSPWLDRGLRWAPVTGVDASMSVGGCGTLIGADRAGRAVTVALTSAPTVVVTGEQSLLWQLVIRAVATGSSIRITTDRPDYWTPLLGVIGDPAVVCLDDAAPPRNGPPAIRIIDETRCVPGRDMPTFDGGTALIVCDNARAATLDAELKIIQDPAAPGFVDVETSRHRLRVSVVATPQEWRLLAGSRTSPPAHPRPTPVDRINATTVPVPVR